MSNEASAVEEVKKPVPLWNFWNKHAMPPLSRPSCFVCGRVPDQWPPAVQHLELPAVVCCHICKAASERAIYG
jgi:hypothetical protein